jgi:hypothetical protein
MAAPFRFDRNVIKTVTSELCRTETKVTKTVPSIETAYAWSHIQIDQRSEREFEFPVLLLALVLKS